MKSLLHNGYLALGARIVLGMVFLVASIEKVADPAAFATSIGYYRLITGDTAMLAATVLPWVELLCALALLFGVALRGSSLLCFLMLVVFVAAIVSALARGLDISCGCFTRDPSAGKIGWQKLLENSLLILVSVFLYYSATTRFTLEHYLMKLKGLDAR